jgi:hypothetical protein
MWPAHEVLPRYATSTRHPTFSATLGEQIPRDISSAWE